MTERQIIEGCINNDRKAQELLYKTYYNELKITVRKYTDNENIIGEILNDGYLRIFKCLHQYKHQGSFEGWMKRIMFHAVADYFKKYSNYQDNTKFIPFEQMQNENIHTKIMYDQVLDLINTLPKNIQKIMKLSMTGLTHEEVGEKLGITSGTSKWGLSIGRQMLKDKLNKLDSYINLPSIS